MGEWKIVFDGEDEGRLVTVKVYDSDVDGDEDAEPAVRVTVRSFEVCLEVHIMYVMSFVVVWSGSVCCCRMVPSLFRDLVV